MKLVCALLWLSSIVSIGCLVFKSTNSEIFRPVVIGETVTIDCATDDEKSDLRLVKRDREQNTETELKPNGSILKVKDQIFSIVILSKDDGGTYVCNAQIDDTEIEKYITLAVAGEEEGDYPSPVISKIDSIIKEGTKLHIKCQTKGRFAKLSWEKEGLKVTGEKITDKPLILKNGTVIVESILSIVDVRLSDVGTYTCISTSKFDSTKTAQASTAIAVRGTSLAWEKNMPAFNDVSARRGASAILSCRMTHPAKRVNFYRVIADGLLREIRADRKKYHFINDQELAIHSISELDAGTYVCNAENEDLKNKTLQLFVTDDAASQPYVRVHPKFLNLDYDASDNVTCETYGNNAKVQWMKHDVSNGQKGLVEVESEKILGTSSITPQGLAHYKFTLILKHATVKDTGIYVCQVLVGGQPAFSEVTIAVKPPLSPEIRKFTSETTRESLETSLNCRSRGAPKPLVKFYKNGVEITPLTIGYRIDDRKLFIDKPKFPDHDGTYTCSATNIFGKATEKANLTVTVAPIIDKRKSIVVVGDPNELKVFCEIKRSNPIPQIKWQYQPWACPPSKGYRCKPSDSLWQQADSRHITPRYTDVTMRSMFKVPVTDATNYFIRCTAEHKYGDDYHDVIGIIDKRDASSLLKISQKSIELDEEETLTLVCVGEAGLFTNLTWQVNGTDIIRADNKTIFLVNTGSILETQKSVLTIRSVKSLQSGNYKCIGLPARKQDTPVEFTSKVAVNKIYQPKVISLSSPAAKDSEMIIISCEVDAHPKAEITWYKNNELLNNNGFLSSLDDCENADEGKYFFLNENSVDSLGPRIYQLVICKSAWKINTGKFGCQAENRLGKVKKETSLRVFVVPIMLSKQDDEYASPGAGYSRNCSSEGNPSPHMWWEKDNNGIYTAVTANSSSGLSYLNFSKLVNNDFGKYRCVAANNIGVTIDEMFLKQPLITASTYKTGNDMGATASLIAALIAGVFIVVLISILVVILYKRKQLYGGFYILSIPPSPDYFKKLDPTKSIAEQVHKLPYFPEWEFPRNKLKIKNQVGAGAFGEVYIADAFGIANFDPRYKISTKHKPLISRTRLFSLTNYKRSRSATSTSSITKMVRADSVASTSTNRSTKSSTKQDNRQSSLVAVKKLKEDATQLEYSDLISEMKILIHVGQQENIVNLLGACTKGVEKDTMVILEFCPHGNLLSFMKERRQTFKPIWSKQHIGMEKEFTTFDLCVTAYQIAKGLEYLSSRKCVHRDVAARNVLVGENYVMKVADFGLARDVYQDERYVKISGGLLPIKWMAIEAIVDRVFTHKTDVWAFGVLLWELMTLGGSPYPGIHVKDLLDYLTSGDRMVQPQFCPDEIYQLMRECWRESSDQRPTFSDVLTKLAKVIEAHCNPEEINLYIDKCHVSGGSVSFGDEDYLRAVDSENGSVHYSPPPPYSQSPKDDSSFKSRQNSLFRRTSSERYVPDNRLIEENTVLIKERKLNNSISDRSIEPKSKMEEFVSEKDQIDSVFIDINEGNKVMNNNNFENAPLYKNVSPKKICSLHTDEDKDEYDENSHLLNHHTPSPVVELSNYINDEYDKTGKTAYINA